jgi:shikimate kinase
MGTGKTTIGQRVASRLGWPFADTDHVIESRQKRSIREIFAQDGETAFRNLEAELCREVITWRRTVLATGGGIILNPANREALASAGLVICLEAPAHEIVARLHGASDRPLLAGADPEVRITELLAARAEAYAALPHHLDTTGSTPDQLAQAVIALWNRERQPSDVRHS